MNSPISTPMQEVTTNQYGVDAPLRRPPELLPNGKWRLDFASGLVELRNSEPETFGQCRTRTI